MSKNSSSSSPNDRIQQILNHFKTRKSSKKLSGKVCILTGVGHEKGIGYATALLFAKEDAKHLYLIDLKGDNLPNLVNSIKIHNSTIGLTSLAGDASDENFIQSVCKKVMEEHGQLDVFFANAGVATASPIEKTSYDTAERILKINTMSCWLALKYGSAAMLESNKSLQGSGDKRTRGGSIIMTASAAGIRSGAGSNDYSASKAGVISLALTGANSHPGSGIRVNAICPGLINTQMTGPIFQLAKDTSKLGQLCPLRRYAMAEEVASVVLFLASDDSSYVTGTAIPVDGGLSSSLPVIPGKMY